MGTLCRALGPTGPVTDLATVLGATGRPSDVGTLAARLLTEMCQTTVHARARQKDAGGQKRIAQFHSKAATARKGATMYRTAAVDDRTEKALGERIAQ
ncbi:hypothetical protein [Streptomyces arboris]|uniref:Uncharacterized protein n=1 Tax=Streptomyces arboris TaxID=2600619 RepID=A0A5N5EBB3_9ACTN|nr:hypothetical protein [Streptomyces arboris]KAB2587685.1 hypothetical protein F5983_36625 [Streptomyces arboris]